MELLQLEHFLVLCETLNFRAASEKINASPSTLSRSIRRMEDELGCALFERDNRQVFLTHQGDVFRRWATTVLDGFKELSYRIMEDQSVIRGELSIFGSVTAYYSVMSPIIEEFRTTYPRIHLKLHTGSPVDAHTRIEKNEADIAITMLQDSFRESLIFQPIVTTPLVFIAPTENSMQPRDIEWKKQPMVLPSRGTARDRVDSWFRKKLQTPNIYAQVEGNEAILAMVSLGCGIGVVPGLVLEKSPLKDKIRIIDVRPALEPYIVGLLTRKNRLQNPIVHAFWELAAKMKQ